MAAPKSAPNVPIQSFQELGAVAEMTPAGSHYPRSDKGKHHPFGNSGYNSHPRSPK